MYAPPAARKRMGQRHFQPTLLLNLWRRQQKVTAMSAGSASNWWPAKGFSMQIYSTRRAGSGFPQEEKPGTRNSCRVGFAHQLFKICYTWHITWLTNMCFLLPCKPSRPAIIAGHYVYGPTPGDRRTKAGALGSAHLTRATKKGYPTALSKFMRTCPAEKRGRRQATSGHLLLAVKCELEIRLASGF